MDKTDNFKQEIAAVLEPRLASLEQMVSGRAERIAEKLNDKAAKLQEWEAGLQAKQEELRLLQNRIDACQVKMKGLEEAEVRLNSFNAILLEREEKLKEKDLRKKEEGGKR